MKQFSFFLFIFAGLFVNNTSGEIQCYTCISQGGGDDTCIRNPAAAPNPTAKCKYKYCTIRRIEYPSEPGVIQSFLRGCEDYPLPDGENASSDLIVWAQSCNYADLCNVGDGLSSLKPGSGGSGGAGAGGPVIVIPLSSNTSTQLQGSASHLLMLIAIAAILRQF